MNNLVAHLACGFLELLSLIPIRYALLIVALLFSCFRSHGKVIQSTVNGLPTCGAADGDTVYIPAGTYVITSAVVLPTAACSIIGAGVGSTVLIDQHPNRGSFCIGYSTSTAGKVYYFGNLTIRGYPSQTSECTSGILAIAGNGTVVVHDIDFDHVYGPCILPSGAVNGVEYNISKRGDLLADNDTYVSCGSYYGALNGNGSWANPVPWGQTTNCWVMEDEVTTNLPTNTSHPWLDCYSGSFAVARHMLNTNTFVSVHGNDTTGTRSVRAIGISYTTNVMQTNYLAFLAIRGGTASIHDNFSSGFQSFGLLANYQMFAGFWFGGGNGTNSWNSNNPSILQSGTHTGTNGATVLVDSNASGWIVNQWVGCTLQNLDIPNFNGGGTCGFGEIIANTANSITCANIGIYGSNNVFQTGQHYQIRQVISTMDQIGRGMGQLVAGSSISATNIVTGGPTWPLEASEPAYFWNNNHDGAEVSASDPQVTYGRDWITNTPGPNPDPPYPHPLHVIRNTSSVTASIGTFSSAQ